MPLRSPRNRHQDLGVSGHSCFPALTDAAARSLNSNFPNLEQTHRKFLVPQFCRYIPYLRNVISTISSIITAQNRQTFSTVGWGTRSHRPIVLQRSACEQREEQDECKDINASSAVAPDGNIHHLDERKARFLNWIKRLLGKFPWEQVGTISPPNRGKQLLRNSATHYKNPLPASKGESTNSTEIKESDHNYFVTPHQGPSTLRYARRCSVGVGLNSAVPCYHFASPRQ